eukprot:scaffold293880_cov14-Tisochrysis_lutea.AAC.1
MPSNSVLQFSEHMQPKAFPIPLLFKLVLPPDIAFCNESQLMWQPRPRGWLQAVRSNKDVHKPLMLLLHTRCRGEANAHMHVCPL